VAGGPATATTIAKIPRIHLPQVEMGNLYLKKFLTCENP
jgi:hypothetical protein